MSNLENTKIEEMKQESEEETKCEKCGAEKVKAHGMKYTSDNPENTEHTHEDILICPKCFEKCTPVNTEKFYEVFGHKITKEERDRMTMDMILIEVSNGIREYYQRGGDARILHDQLINTFSYRELSDFVSDADASLRAPKR